MLITFALLLAALLAYAAWTVRMAHSAALPPKPTGNYRSHTPGPVNRQQTHWVKGPREHARDRTVLHGQPR